MKLRRTPDKIFRPKFIRINAHEFPGYDYIKEIQAGDSRGHILHREGTYILCLSQNDNVSSEERFVEPLGFKRSSVDELVELATHLTTKREPKKTSIKKVPARYEGLEFERDGERFRFQRLLVTAARIGVSTTLLRKAVNERRPEIRGWNILYLNNKKTDV